MPELDLKSKDQKLNIATQMVFFQLSVNNYTMFKKLEKDCENNHLGGDTQHTQCDEKYIYIDYPQSQIST